MNEETETATNIYLYHCLECSFSANSKDIIIEHRRRHEFITETPNLKLHVNKWGVRIITCKICGYRAAHERDLLYHLFGHLQHPAEQVLGTKVDKTLIHKNQAKHKVGRVRLKVSKIIVTKNSGAKKNVIYKMATSLKGKNIRTRRAICTERRNRMMPYKKFMKSTMINVEGYISFSSSVEL